MRRQETIYGTLTQAASALAALPTKERRKLALAHFVGELLGHAIRDGMPEAEVQLYSKLGDTIVGTTEP
jgi:hypothetical protein